MRRYVILSKLKAAGVHALVSLSAILLLILLTTYWFQGPLLMLGDGVETMKIIFFVEMILGPGLSLIMFHPVKSVRELVIDYSLIALFQLSALVYGISVLAGARPISFVLVKDRFEVALAGEMGYGMLNSAFKKPKWRTVEFPVNDPHLMSEITFSSLAGRDIHLMPEYYRDLSFNDIQVVGVNLERVIKVAEGLEIDVRHQLEDLKREYGACVVVPGVYRDAFIAFAFCDDDFVAKRALEIDLWDLGLI